MAKISLPVYLLGESHPEYQVKALVRDTAKGEAIKKSFEQVQVVKGSLDDLNLIAQEAREADVVLHMGATGHLKSVQAIHEVLASNPKGDKSQKWVQIGGASLLAAAELADKARVPGTGSEVVHYDLQGIEETR